ncbi:MAG: response regulator transcription factor [Deltaproteobacteria bacterium]|nr:response regulator transcription factor [Deltaproteobacteria bacterium]
MTVLLVEDTRRLAATLSRGLAEEGYEVDAVESGEEGLARLESRLVEAVILDLGLPDLDGLEVLARARAAGHRVPVLVLTARDGLDDRVRALDLGADDYLVKPFAFAELLARLRALLRRAAAPRWTPLAAGDLALDPGEAAGRVAGEVVPLSPRERALLELFLSRPDEVLDRPTILREAFGYDFDPGTNVIDVHVAHLRRKLAASRARIETVRGVGYRLATGRTHG